MNSDIVYSKSGKYMACYEDIANREVKEFMNNSSGKVNTKNEYRTVKIINTIDKNIIYQYKLECFHHCFGEFITINDNEWWFGGRHYMLHLFVNCNTREVYDDPNNKEESDEYKQGFEFIWTGPYIISPDGKYMFMDGCMWACPYEWRLYDISDLKNGYKEFDLLDLDFGEENNKLLDDNDHNITDSDIFNFKFISNNEVEVYNYKKYFMKFKL